MGTTVQGPGVLMLATSSIKLRMNVSAENDSNTDGTHNAWNRAQFASEHSPRSAYSSDHRSVENDGSSYRPDA